MLPAHLVYTYCIHDYTKDILDNRRCAIGIMKEWVWNASFIVQEEFRAKRREVFFLHRKKDLSFWFVIGTAVRDCAQEKKYSSSVRKPAMGLSAMITS